MKHLQMAGQPLNLTKNTEIPFEVMERFSLRNGVPLADSIQYHSDMVDFLDESFLERKMEHPSKVVDEVWHQFILHTKLYYEFCKERYGVFIHHKPLSMKLKEDNSFQAILNREKSKSNAMVMSDDCNWNDDCQNDEPASCPDYDE